MSAPWRKLGQYLDLGGLRKHVEDIIELIQERQLKFGLVLSRGPEETNKLRCQRALRQKAVCGACQQKPISDVQKQT